MKRNTGFLGAETRGFPASRKRKGFWASSISLVRDSSWILMGKQGSLVLAELIEVARENGLVF